MPEIKITEKDLTTGYVDEQDYVVFVPGNVGKFASDSDESARKQYEYLGKTTLFGSLTDFIDAIGSTPTEYSDTGTPFTIGTTTYDAGFLYAKFLLSKGYKIYYAVPKSSSESAEITISQKSTQETQSIVYSSMTQTTFENGTTGEKVAIGGEGVYHVRYQQVNVSYNNGAVFKDAKGEHSINYNSATTANKTAWWSDGSFVDDGVTYNQLISTVITTTTITGKTYQYTTYAGMVNALNQTTFYTDLDDKSLYQFRFLTTGGYSVAPKDIEATLPTSITQIETIALNRGDCIALIDHDKNLTTSIDITAAATKASVGESAKRSAMFSPWCKYAIDDLTLPMPASMAYLEAFINGVSNNPTWYAMAGRLRGSISGTPIIIYGEKFAERLNNPNGNDTGVCVNAIANVYPYGILIWGNRTLNNNSEITASSLLNIRQLCVDIFKSLYINAKGYMFEQNTDRLWFNFKAKIEKLLDNMKTGEGIEGYKIIRETGDRITVKATIRIVPIGAVEKFDLTVELSDTLEASVTLSE